MNLKTTFAALAMAFCGMANAQQQIANGDFETWTYDGVNLPNNWNSFQTAGGTFASTAYSSSNRQVKQSKEVRPGTKGKYSTVIWCRAIIGIPAQGNLTTGRINAGAMTATAKANYNYTSIGQKTTNNGVDNPLAMKFTGKPDSIVVWAKFVPAKIIADYPNAKFSAVIHDAHNYISYGLPENDTEENKGYVVASAVHKIESKGGVWQRISIPFEYAKNTNAQYIQLNASTNAYPGKGSAGDSLYIDDIECVYNHSLSALSYNGKAVAGFAETKYSYTVDEVYDASKLAYTKTGVASTVTTSYNETSALLTIKVKGDDGITTTYTVQFKKPTIVNMTITDAKYATFVSPYQVTAPQGVTVYRCFNVGANRQLTLVKQSGADITANVPVILYSEKPVSQTFTGIAQYTSPVKVGIFTGVYSDTPAPKGSYVLQNIDGVTGFYKVVDAIPTVKANRCYITLPTSSSAKMLGFATEEETAINAINALTSGKIETIYNASGVRQPSLQKGMNIVKMSDGTIQKILVK